MGVLKCIGKRGGILSYLSYFDMTKYFGKSFFISISYPNLSICRICRKKNRYIQKHTSVKTQLPKNLYDKYDKMFFKKINKKIYNNIIYISNVLTRLICRKICRILVTTKRLIV